MPLVKSPSKAAFKTNVAEMIRAGRPRAQALAASYATARKSGAKFAPGGMIPTLSPMGRTAEHNLMRQGLISSPLKSPGRADKIPLKVPSGSSIVPADVVSGLGQGNSASGANILSKMMSTGPYGVKTPHGGGQKRFPRGLAEGGEVETADILASDGEYVVPVEAVLNIGGGDLDRGHAALNKFYELARADYVKSLKKMKPPHE